MGRYDGFKNRAQIWRVRLQLYGLQRQYGWHVDFYRQNGVDTNIETGQQVIDKDVYPVRRCIVLPAKIAREAAQGISVISANKSFVYGGYYDSSTRLFILNLHDRDARALPHPLTVNDWCVYKGLKYEFKQIELVDEDLGVAITGRAVYGDRPEQIHLLSADNLVEPDHETGAQ